MTPPAPPSVADPSRPAAAAAGVLAGALALTALEVGGRLVPGTAPPVLAVGDTVVRAASPSLRDTAVAALGAADKPVLLAGVVLGVLVLTALGGLAARRSRRRGDAAVVVLAAVGLVAQLARPNTSVLGAAGSSAVAVLLGGGALRWLLRTAPAGVPRADRRGFLLAGVAIGAATLGGAALVRVLDARADVERLRAAIRLPRARRPARANASAAALDVPGLSPLLTPNRDFYRIDTALRVPQVDVREWTLTVDGAVDRELVLDLDDLLARPQVEADVTLQCVSNEVGGGLVGTARWQGVRLADLLREAGVRPGADQVVGWSVDGFSAGFPTAVALDGREALVAVGMNGELLPVRHGFPARLVVPGLYGYVSATKWLHRIELTTLAGFDGFWVPRGWAKQAPVKTASRIDVPRRRAQVPAGDVVVAGVAWAPTRGIGAVEVQVDEGPWRRAELPGALSDDTWRQWRLVWPATAGEHVLRVRALDGDGAAQDERRRPPRPDGATGLHAVPVRVV